MVLNVAGDVCRSKVHYEGLEQATTGEGSRVRHVSFFDPDVVVSPAYVDFGNYRRASQLVHDIG